MSIIANFDDDGRHALNAFERARQLRSLADWTYDDKRRALHRRIKFATFEDVIVALVRIGVAAERMDHHREWSNVYDVLDINLTTHDTGDVTMLDFDLARLIDLIVAETKAYHPMEVQSA